MTFRTISTTENSWPNAFNQVEMQQKGRGQPKDPEELQRKRKVERDLFPIDSQQPRNAVKSALDETEAMGFVKSDEEREQEEKRRLTNAKYASQITIFNYKKV